MDCIYKKIILIDYCGSCDREGQAIGHSLKVLTEYADLLKDDYKLEAIVPNCIHNSMDSDKFDKVLELPYQIVEEDNRGLFKRLIDKYKLFHNITLSNKYSNNDILWYYRTDFFLFLYYFFHRKPKNKVLICLLYQQTFGEGIMGKALDFVFRKGLSKFDAVIYTQKDMNIPHHKTLYMPDYYYDAAKYDQYRLLPKADKVVCLGTMNPYKELEKLVDVFNENGVSLEIVGRFLDHQRYLDLQCRAKDNIMIEDVILSEEDYYQKLAGARYAVMPYDMKAYEGRTSGVLQEAVFVGTIPIAPKRLLEENGVQGIGYERLEDMRDFFTELKTDMIRADVLNFANKEQLKEDICNFISI